MNEFGTFVTKDSFNAPIVLEWKKVHGHTDDLAQIIQSNADLLVSTYAQVEVDFARKNPELVAQDFMLKSLAPVLDDVDNIDWNLFRHKVEEQLQNFFVTFDWKAGSGTHDVYFFVVAKDQKTNERLGIIQFLNTPDFKKNTFKAGLFGIALSAQNRGISTLLLASIFTIVPHLERIFLHTRSTNSYGIDFYQQLGFVLFEGKLPNWTDLEYLANEQDTLQKLAQRMQSQE